jgi:hypothetical protein
MNVKLNMEKAIDEEMERYNDQYYSGVYDCLNLINYNLFNEINTKQFWKSLLTEHTCDYEHKDEKNYKKICNRSIYIKCLNDNGKYRCCRHAPKDSYEKNKNKIEENERCIGITKYNERCNIKKKFGNYCVHHVPKNKTTIEDITENNIVQKIDEDNKVNEIKLICYNNRNFGTQIIQEDEPNKEIIELLEKEKINKFPKKSEVDQIYINRESLKEFINMDQIINNYRETYNESINLNTNINNFKHKLELIKEILNTKPTCNFRNCKDINTIYICKSLYCQQHSIYANYNKTFSNMFSSH